MLTDNLPEEEEKAQEAKAEMQAGAVWPELKTLQHADEGRDVKVAGRLAAGSNMRQELTLVKEQPSDADGGAEGGVDPALWGCSFLNRLSLKVNRRSGHC